MESIDLDVDSAWLHKLNLVDRLIEKLSPEETAEVRVRDASAHRLY